MAYFSVNPAVSQKHLKQNMTVNMWFVVHIPCESHFTDCAHVRFLPRMRPHVSRQFPGSLDDFVADGTLLRGFGFHLPLLLQLPGWEQRPQVGCWAQEAQVRPNVCLVLDVTLWRRWACIDGASQTRADEFFQEVALEQTRRDFFLYFLLDDFSFHS